MDEIWGMLNMQKLIISIIAIEMMIIFNTCTFSHNLILQQRPVYASSINYDYDAYLRYVTVGIDYKEKGQYTQAIQQFRLAITKKPDEYIPFMLIGGVYLDQGKYGLAIDNYNEAISIAPHKSELYIRRGNAFERIKKYYSALKDYNEAIVMDNACSYAYQRRSELYAHLGNKVNAIDDSEKAMALEKNCTSYLSAAQVYNTLHDYRKSVYYYGKALSVSPKDRVAEIQKWLNEEKENLKAAIEITGVSDESPLAYYSAALMNNSYGNYDKAYEYSLKALELDAKYYAAHYCLGTALIGLHQYDDALKVLNKGLSGTKEKWLIGVLYRERGRIYLHKKDYHKAIDDFNKSIMYNESSEEYYYRGEAYRYMQEYNKAYADYQKAIFLKNWSYKPYYALEEIAPYVTIK